VKQRATKIVGWSFVCLGFIGLFLPFLQGVLFLLIGLFILSPEYVWAQRMLEELKARFPSMARRAAEASASATVWLRGVFLKLSQRE
jgi:uncharacterized membrane protein YbaN (DUF454 family)